LISAAAAFGTVSLGLLFLRSWRRQDGSLDDQAGSPQATR
jgi:hypothetical protein